MEAKTFEVRDRATFLPMLAVRLNPGNEGDRYLLSRTGYGRTSTEQGRYILLTALTGGEGSYDPFGWGSNRTRKIAHQHIVENWDLLESGQVIDVQYILGETAESKQSEAVEVPL